MKSKTEQLKEALKNPPPERLAAIEYRSHALQSIGIIFVCVMLIAKGYWYVIFALIFGVGVSYSQGMSAYARYKTIKSLSPPEKIENFDKDISWTRRRSKIINYSLGGWANWISIIVSVLTSVALIGAENSRWLLMVSYPIMIMVLYIFLYFFVSYWVANPIYIQGCKEVKKDGRRRRV